MQTRIKHLFLFSALKISNSYFKQSPVNTLILNLFIQLVQLPLFYLWNNSNSMWNSKFHYHKTFLYFLQNSKTTFFTISLWFNNLKLINSIGTLAILVSCLKHKHFNKHVSFFSRYQNFNVVHLFFAISRFKYPDYKLFIKYSTIIPISRSIIRKIDLLAKNNSIYRTFIPF